MAQARQREVEDTTHESHEFSFMLGIEMAKIGFGVCNCRANIRGVAFDDEMEVSGTVELELERRLTRLKEAAVLFYPPRRNES